MTADLLRSLILALGLIVTCQAGLTLFKKARTRRRCLPPGPPGLPLIGHAGIIPTDNPEYYYHRLSKQYQSDILAFNVLGQHVIVLNSVKAASDLLDRRGGNYCDRPDFVLFDIMGWKRTLTFLRYGPVYRMHRRGLHSIFRRSAITRFQPIQERETAVMLKGIAWSHQNWEPALRRFSTAVIMDIGFGHRVSSDSDPFIPIAAAASHALAHAGAPGGTPVDFFPLLRHLPRWLHDRSLKFANDCRQAIHDMHHIPYETAMASPASGPSVIQGMSQLQWSDPDKRAEYIFTTDDVKGAAAAVYAAGQDTIWSTLLVFVLNMVLHPDVQKKAQLHLDEVVGRERLPHFNDRPGLFYVEHVLQETLRWCPVSPMGVPHRSLEDDIYNGYDIPAGSFVYANARAMTHDDRVYRNPDVFNPDRYCSTEDGGQNEPYPVGPFGFGRRICVGRHVAESSLWIVMASMLSTMSLVKETDPDGRPIEPEIVLTNGLTSHPELFPCKILPRDSRAEQLIKSL